MKQKMLVLIMILLSVGSSQAMVVNDTICQGNTITIGNTYPNGVWYLWNTGATTVQITVSPTVSTTYTVAVLNDTMAVIARDTFNIMVAPKPNVWITGPAIICSGGTATLVAHGGLTYQWLTGTTNDTIIVAPTITTNYIVVGYSSNGCSDTANFVVTVQALPTIYTITGDTSYCAEQAGVLVGLNGSEADCSYKLYQNGIVISTINGTGYPLSFGYQPNGMYTIKGFKNNLGCEAQMNGTLHVTTLPLPQAAGVISGPSSVCQNAIVTYSTSAIQYATSYDWSIPTGATLVSGQGTTMITVNFGSATSGDVKVRGHNDCGDGPYSSLFITVNSAPNLTITATSTDICVGESVVLTANSNGNTFLWSNGLTTSSITVSPLTTSTYSVVVTGISGCSSTGNITIMVYPLPTISITTSASEICAGESVVLTANSNGNTFLWSNGLTTSSITVSPLTTSTYSVTVSGEGGCSSTGNITITVHPLTTVSLILNQDNFCTDVYSAIITGGYPSGGTYTGECVFNGNTVYPAASGTGTYTVTYTVTNSYGCSASATDLLTINPVPAVMFTNLTTGVYIDTPAFDLMSYVSPTGGMFSGPGMIGSFFYPAMAGSGTHMITYTYTHPITGCSATQIQYIPVGALGISETVINNITIFPNPTSNTLHLKDIDTKEIQTISIVNVLGKVVFTTETLTEAMEIDVSTYDNGMYIIRFTDADGLSRGKLFMKH